MKIRWHTPYLPDGSERYDDPVWPTGWPLPAVGSTVCYPAPEITMLWVKAIDYFPHGEEDGPEPFVYIVLSTKPH